MAFLADYNSKELGVSINEAKALLARVRDEPSIAEEVVEEAGAEALMQELQCLPLAISQAGAYMRRIPLPT